MGYAYTSLKKVVGSVVRVFCPAPLIELLLQAQACPASSHSLTISLWRHVWGAHCSFLKDHCESYPTKDILWLYSILCSCFQRLSVTMKVWQFWYIISGDLNPSGSMRVQGYLPWTTQKADVDGDGQRTQTWARFHGRSDQCTVLLKFNLSEIQQQDTDPACH